MEVQHFDVFVSYRRNGGSAIASFLAKRLCANPSIRVFLDVEDIESGDWDEKIQSSLIASSNFLFLLTPGSLGRCFSDPGGDIVLKEIRTACAYRRQCEDSPELGSAESRFRIIPVFLGEDVEALCREHQLTHPEVVEDIRALVRHNGINLNDSMSIEKEMSRLESSMLLKRTGIFAGTLVGNALSSVGSSSGDREQQELEELFTTYLRMFDPDDYANVRKALRPLVHSRLTDVLESGEFVHKIGSFRLGALKGACAALIHRHASHGSRQRVVHNIETWLKGNDVPVFPVSAGLESIDRKKRIVGYLTQFIAHDKRVTRARLSEVIRMRTGSGLRADFQFFSPQDWIKYQSIVDEMLERIPYSSASHFFFKKNWLNLQRISVSKYTSAERKSRRQFLTDLQRFVWAQIQEDYPGVFERLSKNASINTIVGAIEGFLSYREDFAWSESDCKPLAVSDEFDEELEQPDDLEDVGDVFEDDAIPT